MSILQPTGAASNPIFLRGTNRVIGVVRGQWFEKTIAASKHLLRKPEAIAFDTSTLDDAERAGADAVFVRDCETGTLYRQQIAVIRRFGFSVSRGFGRQVALPLTHFSINGQPPEVTPGAAVTNQERKDLQLDLFGNATSTEIDRR